MGVTGSSRRSVVTTPKPAAQVPAPAAMGSSKTSQRKSPGVQQNTQGCRTCPTCGSGRFCSSCGVPVWQVNVLNFVPQGMVPTGMMIDNNYEMPAGQVVGCVPDQGDGPCDSECQMQQQWVQQPMQYIICIFPVFFGPMQMMYCIGPKNTGKMQQ